MRCILALQSHALRIQPICAPIFVTQHFTFNDKLSSHLSKSHQLSGRSPYRRGQNAAETLIASAYQGTQTRQQYGAFFA
jgi:hypothetical protein